MLVANAAERNKEFIFKILTKYVEKTKHYKCLEIASGTGAHVAYFAKKLPNVDFQPSECNSRVLHSIVAHVDKLRLPNLRVPLYIDITKDPNLWALPEDYAPSSIDILVCINMIHISSNAAVEMLFKAADGLLRPESGVLLTYGPYAFEGNISPESNIAFHQNLQQQNPEWGLRDVVALKKIAKHNNLGLEKIHEMPMNNHCLLFRRNSD